MVNRNTLILVGALLIVGYFLIGSGSGIGNGDGGFFSKKQVTCEVTLDNELFQDIEIRRTNCETGGSCYFSTAPLSIGGDNEADLIFTAGGKSKTLAVDVGEFGEETFSLSLCVPEETTTGTIRVVEESSGEVVDTDTVNF